MQLAPLRPPTAAAFSSCCVSYVVCRAAPALPTPNDYANTPTIPSTPSPTNDSTIHSSPTTANHHTLTEPVSSNRARISQSLFGSGHLRRTEMRFSRFSRSRRITEKVVVLLGGVGGGRRAA